MRKKKVYDADLFVTGDYRFSWNALIKNRKIVKVFFDWNPPETVTDKFPLRGTCGRRWFTPYIYFWDEESLWFIAGRRLIKLTNDMKVGYNSRLFVFHFWIKRDGKTIYRKIGLHLYLLVLPLFLGDDWDDDECFFKDLYDAFQSGAEGSEPPIWATTYFYWKRRGLN